MAELFATTGDGVARITRRGDEWTVALTLHGRGAQCLTLDPHHPGTLFVGSHGKGVWKSGDGGARRSGISSPAARRRRGGDPSGRQAPPAPSGDSPFGGRRLWGSKHSPGGGRRASPDSPSAARRPPQTLPSLSPSPP